MQRRRPRAAGVEKQMLALGSRRHRHKINTRHCQNIFITLSRSLDLRLVTRSAEMPGMARDTGQVVFKFPEFVPARAGRGNPNACLYAHHNAQNKISTPFEVILDAPRSAENLVTTQNARKPIYRMVTMDVRSSSLSELQPVI
eukprot:6212083-Pleurochrysis_carterae.AAC.3